MAEEIDRAVTHKPLPLIVGISGHRDLREQDMEILSDRVVQIFRDLRERYPHTPLLIMSSLAEGADRIVAHAALDEGHELICPLPMARELYELDFSSEASRAEFHELLDRANYWFELPIFGSYEPHEIMQHGLARDHQYAQCGAYLALRSQILIALWNGEHNKLIGGTSQVVRFKLQGVGAPYARMHSPLDVVDSGPVYQIVTPRRSQYNVPSDAFALKRHYPNALDIAEQSESEFDEIYARIDLFNQDALTHLAQLSESRTSSKSYIMPKDRWGDLSFRGHAMLDLYSVADTLSIHFQRSTLRTLRAVLWVVFLAASFFHIYTHIYYKTPLFLWIYLVVFAIAYAWHYFASKGKYQAKYLDYRALAEGLRIQFYWQVSGIHDSVAFYYLRKQKSALDWVRHGVRSSLMSVLALQHPGGSREALSLDDYHFFNGPEEDRIRTVKQHWIDDQANYFERSAHREHHKLEKFERAINGCLMLGFVLSIIQLWIAPSHALWLAIGLSAVGAGMLHTYTDKRAFNQHSKQYQRMGSLFKRASGHLDDLIEKQELAEAREFIGEIGREALIENGDWIHTHRDRPIEVPKGA